MTVETLPRREIWMFQMIIRPATAVRWWLMLGLLLLVLALSAVLSGVASGTAGPGMVESPIFSRAREAVVSSGPMAHAADETPLPATVHQSIPGDVSGPTWAPAVIFNDGAESTTSA